MANNEVMLVLYNTGGPKPHWVLTMGAEGLKKALDISEHHTDTSVRIGRFWIYLYKFEYLASEFERFVRACEKIECSGGLTTSVE